MMEDEWIEAEEKCEGKTILTLSADDSGMIIRFTDGTILKFMDGIIQFEE